MGAMGQPLAGEVREERGYFYVESEQTVGDPGTGAMSQSLLRKKQTIKESGKLY